MDKTIENILELLRPETVKMGGDGKALLSADEAEGIAYVIEGMAGEAEALRRGEAALRKDMQTLNDMLVRAEAALKMKKSECGALAAALHILSGALLEKEEVHEPD